MKQSEEEQQQALKEAALYFHGGVALLPILSVVFIWQLGLSVPDGIFTALLLGTLPLISMAQLPLLDQGKVERLSAYAGSIVLLIILATVALLLAFLGSGLEALGLGPVSMQTLGLGLGAGLGGILLLGGLFSVMERVLDLNENPILLELIPRTGQERTLFAFLSGAAGFGEEVVYRGYLLAVLAPAFTSVWTAALVSTLAFSILHAYQGSLGIIRSGLLGFAFAAILIQTGTVWPLVVLHTGVDLVSGLILGPRLLKKDLPN